jgi:hypothetical protein
VTGCWGEKYNEHRGTGKAGGSQRFGSIVPIHAEVTGQEFLGKFEEFRQNHDNVLWAYVVDAVQGVRSEARLKDKARVGYSSI